MSVHFANLGNYFMFPIEIMRRAKSVSELRVLLYIARHSTFDPESEYGPIPLFIDEFVNGRLLDNGTRMDQGTGLSKVSVSKGIRQAKEQGFLKVQLDFMDGGRNRRVYTIQP